MDFLNKSFIQLSELFQSMTVGARITSALLLVAVVASLGYLFTGRISSPDCDLMHGMPIPAAQIPAMEAAFAKAKLTGYEIRGTQILVPRGQSAAYQAALADAKVLPRGFGDYFRNSVQDTGVFEDSKTKDRRGQIALQEELANIITRMQGVETASVILSSDTKSGLSREKVNTASVSVKPIGETQLDEAKVSSIRHCVASAIASMKPEDVTVTDLNGRSYPGGGESGSAEEDAYVNRKRLYEEDLKRKIVSALSFIPNVVVEPQVVLDRELGAATRKVLHDPKGIPYSVTESNKSHTRDSTPQGGRPGYGAQQPNAAMALPAAAMTSTKEEEEDSKSEVRNLVSGTITDTRLAGLTPKMAKVSVGLPSSYFVKIWHERNDVAGETPKTPDKAALDTIRQEETANIQKHVAALLPPPADTTTDVNNLVTVTTFQDMKAPEIPATPFSRQALDWLNRYWSTLGMILLAAMALAMLRSMVRAAPVSTAGRGGYGDEMAYASQGGDARQRTPGAPAPVAAESEEPVRENPLRRIQPNSRSIRDDLSELVREDPNVAANILKSWIGNRG